MQVLLGKHGCTEKVDMYSYGVVLWEICTGESPTGRQLRPVRSAHLVHTSSLHTMLILGTNQTRVPGQKFTLLCDFLQALYEADNVRRCCVLLD